MAASYLHTFMLLHRFILPAACLLWVAQAHAGLVAHYTFNETSGTTAADSSGSGNTGTLTGMSGSEWTTGKVGGALDFDGTNDYVTLGDVTFLDGLNDFSLSAWVKLDSIPSGRAMIFSKDNSFEWFFNSQSINLRLNNGPYDTVNYTFATDTWYHLSVVADSNGKNHYINGTLASTVGSQVALSNQPMILALGGRGGGHSLNGIIDEARIYDHALSASEVAALAAGAGAPEPAETFAFLGLLNAFGLGFREWRSRRKAKAT